MFLYYLVSLMVTYQQSWTFQFQCMSIVVVAVRLYSYLGYWADLHNPFLHICSELVVNSETMLDVIPTQRKCHLADPSRPHGTSTSPTYLTPLRSNDPGFPFFKDIPIIFIGSIRILIGLLWRQKHYAFHKCFVGASSCRSPAESTLTRWPPAFFLFSFHVFETAIVLFASDVSATKLQYTPGCWSVPLHALKCAPNVDNLFLSNRSF